ncbi:MAG: hypothetical protein KatS3mg087_0977 [Patescibacteria group bacterium]|nr:MAG: hypothetical protein KatS3mg087_0977 [Patescibacteria group bacterium]
MKNTHQLDQLLYNTGDMALKRRAQTILNGLDIQDTDKVLDAGGGDGFYTKLVHSLSAAQITLFDFDPRALDSARQNLQGLDRIAIQQGSVMELPFPDNTFDKIICTEVLEHVPDDNLAMRELLRVLKPGGKLAVTVPNHNFPFLWDPVNWIAQNIFHKPIKKSPFDDFFAGIWYGHTRLYQVDSLHDQLRQAGFRVHDLQAVTHWSLPFNHYLLNLMARLLYGGKMSPQMKAAVSKFETTKKQSRPLLIQLGFFIFSTVDKLNDYTKLSDSSVSIYALCYKP